MNSRTTVLLLFLLLVALITTLVFYISKPFGGFFMAVSITLLNRSSTISDGGLLLYNNFEGSSISGNQMFMYIFHSLTGISYETMQWLPLNHLLIAAALFCLARRLAQSAALK